MPDHDAMQAIYTARGRMQTCAAIMLSQIGVAGGTSRNTVASELAAAGYPFCNMSRTIGATFVP